MNAAVDIVVVNWNAGTQLRDCVASIAAARHDGYTLSRVVVVDNASTDGSLEALSEEGIPLLVIRNQENRGFAAACNQGAKGSTADYLLFLNPDAQVFADTLAKSVAFMHDPANARVGIMGAQLLNEAGQVARSCARFPTARSIFGQALGLDHVLPSRFPSHFYTDWDHLDTRAVDQVIGAYFFVRTALFEQLSGFDELFFVYFEEVDFSFRARQNGWSSWFVSDVRAYHKGCGTTDRIRAKRLFYSLSSRLGYARKHFSFPAYGSTLFATTVVEPAVRMLRAALRFSGTECAEIASAYVELLASVAGLWHRPGPSAALDTGARASGGGQ